MHTKKSQSYLELSFVHFNKNIVIVKFNLQRLTLLNKQIKTAGKKKTKSKSLTSIDKTLISSPLKHIEENIYKIMYTTVYCLL